MKVLIGLPEKLSISVLLCLVHFSLHSVLLAFIILKVCHVYVAYTESKMVNSMQYVYLYWLFSSLYRLRFRILCFSIKQLMWLQSNLVMKTQLSTGCLSYISGINKGSESNGKGGDNGIEASAAKNVLKKEKKLKISSSRRRSLKKKLNSKGKIWRTSENI